MHLKQSSFVLPQVQKRNFIENIIPIIISLKSVLEKNKIPALRELMHYLRVKSALGFVVGATPLLVTQGVLQSLPWVHPGLELCPRPASDSGGRQIDSAGSSEAGPAFFGQLSLVSLLTITFSFEASQLWLQGEPSS